MTLGKHRNQVFDIGSDAVGNIFRKIQLSPRQQAKIKTHKLYRLRVGGSGAERSGLQADRVILFQNIRVFAGSFFNKGSFFCFLLIRVTPPYNLTHGYFRKKIL